MLDANIKENIRAITTPEQAYTALGFAWTTDNGEDESELVRNWDRTPMHQHEGKFGVLNKIAVNCDDDTTNLMGQPSIQFHTKRPKCARTVRYLVHADVPMLNVQFPSDFYRYSGSLVDKENPHEDVLFVGGDRWIVCDLSQGVIVEGLAVGDFATMWGLFCTASASELAATYMHFLTNLGEPELRSRMRHMTQRIKDRLRASRKAQERREVAMLRAYHHLMNEVHDACAEAIGGDFTEVCFRLVFIEDAERHLHDLCDTPHYESFEHATKVHASAKRMAELAWVHRSVNGVNTPYAIWNPSSKLWELL